MVLAGLILVKLAIALATGIGPFFAALGGLINSIFQSLLTSLLTAAIIWALILAFLGRFIPGRAKTGGFLALFLLILLARISPALAGPLGEILIMALGLVILIYVLVRS